MTASAAASTDFKAAVCVFLLGGNDSHNTVIPLTGARRSVYDTYRSGITVAAATPTNALGADWRLHPSLSFMKTLWDSNKLAVVHGVGTIIQPTTKASYQALTANLPPQLFSHNSQVTYWQSLPVDGGLFTEGWMGRASELLDVYFNQSRTAPSNVSISGNPLMLRGYETQPSTLTGGGATQVVSYSSGGSNMVSSGAIQRARERNPYMNAIQTSVATRNTTSVSSQALLASTLAPLPSSTDARFTGHASYSSNPMIQQLRTVTRSMYSSAAFGHRRQLYYTGYGTFDTHANQLVDHAARLQQLDDALSVFWAALGDLGLQNSLALFTNSDFGRTLVQNGAGTDHAWSSTQFVLGGNASGGHYGTPPNYTINGPDDTGSGRFIPAHPVEQMAGTVATWLGIPSQHLHLIMPNIANFPTRTIPGLLSV